MVHDLKEELNNLVYSARRTFVALSLGAFARYEALRTDHVHDEGAG